MPSAVATPLFLRPSAADGDGWKIAERIVLGGRLPIDGVADMAALGEALHAVLAYDHPERPIETRLADAQATPTTWRANGFRPKDQIAGADRKRTSLNLRSS